MYQIDDLESKEQFDKKFAKLLSDTYESVWQSRNDARKEINENTKIQLEMIVSQEGQKAFWRNFYRFLKNVTKPVYYLISFYDIKYSHESGGYVRRK